jgi:hypothetical protein
LQQQYLIWRQLLYNSILCALPHFIQLKRDNLTRKVQ